MTAETKKTGVDVVRVDDGAVVALKEERMQLNVSFKHADPSEAVVAHVEQRARSVAGKTAAGADSRLRVVCGYDAAFAEVEVVGRVGRHLVVGRGRAIDMDDAVDDAFDKVLHQTTREHARLVRRHRARPPSTSTTHVADQKPV